MVRIGGLGFWNWFYCFDGAQFYVLLDRSCATYLQHLTAKEFKSDGSGIGRKGTKLLADWSCDLDTHDIQEERRFALPYILQ